MKKTRIYVLLVVLLALVVLLLVRCGSSSDGPSPTAELSLIGARCDSPGELTRVDGATFVCVSFADAEGAKESKAIYYGVAAAKETVCDDPGAKRKTNGIVEVCSGGKDAKKRKWVVTAPVPLAVSVFFDVADSTDPDALEEAGIPVPEAIAMLPGMQEFAVAESSTTTVAPTTTTDEPTTTTAAPTATTDEPTTTTAASTTTVASTTTAPSKVLACAEGGACKNGDIGPGGGTVLVWENETDATAGVFEVAPVTWYLKANKAFVYADRLVYGAKSDWRLPIIEELTAVAANRNLFTCPGVKRCANGFANNVYFFNSNPGGDNAVKGFHLVEGFVTPDQRASAYVRPVRSITGAVG